MKIEHIAFNVSDPNAMAEWYVINLGMSIVKRLNNDSHTHFLADNSGDGLIEIYNNPKDQVPDYVNMNPLLLHLAFVCESPNETRLVLEASGASFVDEVLTKDKSHLIMMRDPWGLSIQLCKRSKKLLKCQKI